MTNTLHSQAHVRWDCTYHIVFAPKYRKKVLFGVIRNALGQIFRELTRQKGIEIVQGTIKPDHVHMMLRIPPKHSVASIVGFLKGKSAILLHNRFAKKKSVTQKEFWARGYFVRTTGLDQKMAEEYIRKQIEDDQQNDGNPQMEFQW
jgi:putative transposase